jgi:hypothetical protein
MAGAGAGAGAALAYAALPERSAAASDSSPHSDPELLRGLLAVELLLISVTAVSEARRPGNAWHAAPSAFVHGKS